MSSGSAIFGKLGAALMDTQVCLDLEASRTGHSTWTVLSMRWLNKNDPGVPGAPQPDGALPHTEKIQFQCGHLWILLINYFPLFPAPTSPENKEAI